MILEQAVKQAAELAHDEDMDMVVGREVGSRDWVIRSLENPESDALEDPLRVSVDGVVDGQLEDYERLIAADA